ncbi:hypothetical protein L6R53_14355 [Myxococcota bacterium]|nr:hypothetical protein [Myxococcota bacterium]
MTQEQRWTAAERRRAVLVALVAGLCLWAPLLGRAAPALGRELLGIAHFDAHGTWWFYWYVEQVLREGASPLHTDLFFHPWGKDIYGDTGANLLDALLAAPLRVALGPILGMNLFVLLGMAATGAAVGWLARALVREPGAVGLAAALGSATPYALGELVEGRPTQALLVLPALALGSMLRLPDRGGGRLPALGGLALALTGYQYWYYGLFLGLAGLVLAAVQVAQQPAPRRPLVRRHLLLLGLGLLLALPGAWPMLVRVGEGQVTGLFDPSTWTLAHQRLVTVDGHEVALFLWQPLRGQAGFLHQHDSGQEVFLGLARYTPLVFALAAPVGLWALGRRRGPALAVGLLGATLAMGPVVLVGDLVLPNPPYLALVHLLPVFRRLWWPGRAYVLLALLGPVLVAAAVGWGGRRWGPRAALVAAAGLTLGLVAQLWRDALAPLPTWRPDVPAAMRCLAHGPPGALISLPDAFDQQQLVHQTVHRRPTLGGMNVMLTPPESRALQQDNRFLVALLRLSAASGPYQPRVRDEDRQALLDLGFRYVSLSWESYDLPGTGGGRLRPDEARQSVRNTLYPLLGVPVWEDPRVTLWDLAGEGSPCEGTAIQPDAARLPPDQERTRRPLDLDQKDQHLRRPGQAPPPGPGPRRGPGAGRPGRGPGPAAAPGAR